MANFMYRTDAAYPLTIWFTDTSTDAVAYSWDFGDGTNSISKNPIHTYPGTGTYPVTLTVQNAANVSDTITKTITV